MECSVVKDLIPLYIDDCCSEESAKIVKEHIENCRGCRELYESMNAPCGVTSAASAPKKLRKINDRKASVLQSVLLFASFGIITVGVALEAATPSGFSNGFWAVSLVIPATGFLLSLANWYFVRAYKSTKSFSNGSLLATLGFTICAFIWACFHYECNFAEMLSGISFTDFIELLYGIIFYGGIGNGFVLTVIFCVLSKTLSAKYAVMLSKE